MHYALTVPESGIGKDRKKDLASPSRCTAAGAERPEVSVQQPVHGGMIAGEDGCGHRSPPEAKTSAEARSICEGNPLSA
jgi:hypothetical protein